MSQVAKRFTSPASEQTLQAVARALGERNLTPVVVDTTVVLVREPVGV
jgi:hypothetical protein